MKIYVLIINDRHSDVGVETFANLADAINEARKLAEKYSRGEDIEEVDVSQWDKWMCCFNYSCEGDYTRVMETELNE